MQSVTDFLDNHIFITQFTKFYVKHVLFFIHPGESRFRVVSQTVRVAFDQLASIILLLLLCTKYCTAIFTTISHICYHTQHEYLIRGRNQNIVQSTLQIGLAVYVKFTVVGFIARKYDCISVAERLWKYYATSTLQCTPSFYPN